nr:MAG: hypothetical protein 2 [Luteoviridae sp.]
MITMNYLGEYTGPYWSNGEIQESVEWGEKSPQSQLDFLSRQHDSAYAHYKDARHREAADLLYMREAKKLAGKFPEIAGNLVGYGNYTGRQVSRLLGDVAMSTKLTGNPLGGLLKYGMEGVVNSAKRLNGTYLEKELSDIHRFYSTDPFKKKMPEVIELSSKPGGFAKTPVRGADQKEKLSTAAGQRSIVTPGRPMRPRGDAVSLPVAMPVPLNASSDPKTSQTQQVPIAESRTRWFQRLKRKKKINRVEPLEARIERLTLSQKKKFEKHKKTQLKALESKPGFGGEFAGACPSAVKRARKLRVNALNTKIAAIEARKEKC